MWYALLTECKAKQRDSDRKCLQAGPGQGSRGKTISHRRIRFPPQGAGNAGSVSAQLAGKLQAQQVISVQMANPDGLGPHSPRGTGQTSGRTQGGAGNFQRNQRRYWQRAANNHQSSSLTNVHGRGKLQRILPVLVPTADENRDGQLQPCPLPAFFAGGGATHVRFHPITRLTRPTPHLRGQTQGCPGNGREPAETSLPTRELPEYSPDLGMASPSPRWPGKVQRFSLPGAFSVRISLTAQ